MGNEEKKPFNSLELSHGDSVCASNQAEGSSAITLETATNVQQWRRKNLSLQIPSRATGFSPEDSVVIKMPPTPKRVNFPLTSSSPVMGTEEKPDSSHGFRFSVKTKTVLLLFFLLVGTVLADDSCQRKCGQVSIPYPFGIGEACYLSKWHEVQCLRNPASGQLVAFLPGINRTVLQIDLPRQKGYGSMRIEMNITSTGCLPRSYVFVKSDGREDGEDVLNLTGTPFIIGLSNSLVAVGCDMKALLTGLGSRLVGCVTTCEPGDYTKGCNGFQCCVKKAPEAKGHGTGLSIQGNRGNTTTGGCKVAFLTDEFDSYPSSEITDPLWFYDMEHTTVHLQWGIQTVNLSLFGCPDNSCECHILMNEIGYSTCACSSGYKGNPYILGGCIDIDECRLRNNDGRPKYCGDGSTCVNTRGGYHCVFKKNKALPIVIGVGSSLALLMFVAVTVWLYVIIGRKLQNNRRKRFFKRNGGLLLQQQLNSAGGNVERVKVFTSDELDKATESYSLNRVLGKGGQGTVFKGMLLDGRIVAVKKSIALSEHGLEQFINELVILSRINHRNIVKVLGCCLETEIPILVYEYVPNGDLSHLLHHGNGDSPWQLRLDIAIDVAGALSYMHSEASVKIYHRDIKSSNIMLDENNRAIVADFGISRTVTIEKTHLTTGVAGTFGYMDPEYFQTRLFTDKSDVYCFGVVLIELITGKRPVIEQNQSLARFFALAVKEDRLDDVIDPKLKDNLNLEQVTAASKLAKRCVSRKGTKRPTMREVYVELERIRSLWESSPSTSQFQTAATSLRYDDGEEELLLVYNELLSLGHPQMDDHDAVGHEIELIGDTDIELINDTDIEIINEENDPDEEEEDDLPILDQSLPSSSGPRVNPFFSKIRSFLQLIKALPRDPDMGEKSEIIIV